MVVSEPPAGLHVRLLPAGGSFSAPPVGGKLFEFCACHALLNLTLTRAAPTSEANGLFVPVNQDIDLIG